MTDELAKKPAPEYDKDADYQWQPGDFFTLDGLTFDYTFKALQAFLSTQDAQKVIIAYESLKRMQQVLANAVEQGIAVKIEKTQKNG